MGAPRCQDCNKFVSIDLGEAETQGVTCTFDWEKNEGKIEADVRLTLYCAECGTEVRGADVVATAQFEHDCPRKSEAKPSEHDLWDVSDEESEMDERYETHNAAGKPIKSRYQRKFYIAKVTGNAICPICDAEISFEAIAEEQAGNFEDSY